MCPKKCEMYTAQNMTIIVRSHRPTRSSDSRFFTLKIDKSFIRALKITRKVTMALDFD